MPWPYPDFRMSTITAFANRNAAINEPKKMMSRRSITPRLIEVKCVRKLNEATVSISTCGAQPEKKFSTRVEPLTVKTKQIAAVMTKAMTWLLVIAEMAA